MQAGPRWWGSTDGRAVQVAGWHRRQGWGGAGGGAGVAQVAGQHRPAAALETLKLYNPQVSVLLCELNPQPSDSSKS